MKKASKLMLCELLSLVDDVFCVQRTSQSAFAGLPAAILINHFYIFPR